MIPNLKKCIICMWVLLLAGTIVYAKGYEARKKVGDYEAGVKIDRSPPVLGDNHIEIELKDAAGKTVTDEKVLVNYYMPPSRNRSVKRITLKGQEFPP